MSMDNGLEARVPFSDYRLVQYLFNVPYSMKTVDQVEALPSDLPEEVRLWLFPRKRRKRSGRKNAETREIGKKVAHPAAPPEGSDKKPPPTGGGFFYFVHSFTLSG